MASSMCRGSQVCEAVNFLHTRSPPVVHRDLKPFQPQDKVAMSPLQRMLGLWGFAGSHV